MNGLNQKEIHNGQGLIAFPSIKICLGDGVFIMEKEEFQGHPKWLEKGEALTKVCGSKPLSKFLHQGKFKSPMW